MISGFSALLIISAARRSALGSGAGRRTRPGFWTSACGLALGNVLGQFDVDRARPLGLGELEGVPQHRGDHAGVDDGMPHPW